MKKTGILYVGLLLGFVLTLWLVFMIPNQWTAAHTANGRAALVQEGYYRVLNAGDSGSQLDNHTDDLMLRKSVAGKHGALYNAMDALDYARYWHGYLLWLRPLLVFFSYASIRMVYGFLLVVLLIAVLVLLAKRTNIFITFGLGLALMMNRLPVFFFNMQYANILLITLVTMLVLLWRDQQRRLGQWFAFFLFVGTFTNFIDLLTFPLISWGLPFITALLLTKHKQSFSETVQMGLVTGAGWTVGYAFTWVAKWLIASVVLGRNVVSEALNQILFRTEGSQQIPLERVHMFKLNLSLELMPVNLLLIAVCILFVAVLCWRARRTGQIKVNWVLVATLLIVGAVPYLWYSVLANHSQIHYWFTYREQLITVFAGFAILTQFLPDKMTGATTDLRDF